MSVKKKPLQITSANQQMSLTHTMPLKKKKSRKTKNPAVRWAKDKLFIE